MMNQIKKGDLVLLTEGDGSEFRHIVLVRALRDFTIDDAKAIWLADDETDLRFMYNKMIEHEWIEIVPMIEWYTGSPYGIYHQKLTYVNQIDNLAFR